MDFCKVVTVEISGHSFMSASLISEWFVCMFVVLNFVMVVEKKKVAQRFMYANF